MFVSEVNVQENKSRGGIRGAPFLPWCMQDSLTHRGMAANELFRSQAPQQHIHMRICMKECYLESYLYLHINAFTEETGSIIYRGGSKTPLLPLSNLKRYLSLSLSLSRFLIFEGRVHCCRSRLMINSKQGRQIKHLKCMKQVGRQGMMG